MGKISVRKRGQYYEYRVEIAKIDDKENGLVNQDLIQKMKLMRQGLMP